MGGNQNTILVIALSSIIVVVDVKKAKKKQGARSATTQSSSYADPTKIFVVGLVTRSPKMTCQVTLRSLMLLCVMIN